MKNQKRKALMSPLYTERSYRTEDSIGFLLGRAVSRISDAIDQSMLGLGLRSQQFGLLHAILKGQARTPSDLARLRFQNSAAIAYTLDVLEARKLLTRTPRAEDGRGVDLELTPAGRVLTRSCIARVVEAQNRVLECLDVQEYESLTAVLKRIAGAAQA